MQIREEAPFTTKLQGRAESTLQMAADHGWEKECTGPNCCLVPHFMVLGKGGAWFLRGVVKLLFCFD